jgi:hypothetical protein
MSGEDILSRARLLAKAANEVADQMSLQVDEYKAVIEARKFDEAKNLALETEKKSNYERSRMIDLNDIGHQKVIEIFSHSFLIYLVCQRCCNLWFSFGHNI